MNKEEINKKYALELADYPIQSARIPTDLLAEIVKLNKTGKVGFLALHSAIDTPLMNKAKLLGFNLQYRGSGKVRFIHKEQEDLEKVVKAFLALHAFELKRIE
ncbi:hypothetical protein HUU53_00690 [Candidatus Micrarchaeota archaeon]|nr:hypothetical protein [Candidatus Micrarchaeota archaeon]